jgi:hypothetical protein
MKSRESEPREKGKKSLAIKITIPSWNLITFFCSWPIGVAEKSMVLMEVLFCGQAWLKKESLKVALLTFVLPEQASQEKIFSLLIMNLGFQKSLFLLLAFTRIPFLLFWSAFHNKNKLREYKYLRRCFFSLQFNSKIFVLSDPTYVHNVRTVTLRFLRMNYIWNFIKLLDQ